MSPPPPPIAFRPRDDRYEELRLLGEGGMGQVFRAWDRELRREVVLKVPFLERQEEDTVLRRFLREARHLAKIRHPRIVEIYDVDEGDPPYMVQERLRGRSYDLILEERGSLSRRDARTMFRELAEALTALHDAGIVHRDLKPANFFLREEGGLCLLDFGLSIAVDQTRLTGAASFVGSLRWVPPEVVRGEDPTPASDVYQAGLILYEVLTGELLDRPDPPLWEDLLALADLGGATPPPGPDVPPDVGTWVGACCARNPANRPQSGRALLEIIDRTSSSHSVVLSQGFSSSAVKTVARATPPRRAKLPWLLTLLATALLALGLLGRVYRQHEQPPTAAPPETGPASEDGLQVHAFPDGLFLFHHDPRRSGDRWQIIRPGQPTREGGFEERYGRWEAEIELRSKVKAFELKLLSGGKLRWQRGVELPEALPALPVRVRYAKARLLMDWQFQKAAALDLFVGRGQGQLTRKGRFQDRADIFVPPKRRVELVYELRLGRRTLIRGELMDRIRLQWSEEDAGSFPLDLRSTLLRNRDEIVATALQGDRLYLLHASSRLHCLQSLEGPGGHGYRKVWTRDLISTPDPKKKDWQNAVLYARSCHILPRARDEGIDLVLGGGRSFVTHVDPQGRRAPLRSLGGFTGRSAVLRRKDELWIFARGTGEEGLHFFRVMARETKMQRFDEGKRWSYCLLALEGQERIIVVGCDGPSRKVRLLSLAVEKGGALRPLDGHAWEHRYQPKDLGNAELACTLDDGRIVVMTGDQLLVEEGERRFRSLPLPVPLDHVGATSGIVRCLGGTQVIAATSGANPMKAGALSAFDQGYFYIVELPARGKERIRLVDDSLPIPNLQFWRVFINSFWDPPRLYVPFLQSLAIFHIPSFEGARLEGVEATALEMRGFHLVGDQFIVINDAGRVYGLDLLPPK